MPFDGGNRGVNSGKWSNYSGDEFQGFAWVDVYSILCKISVFSEFLDTDNTHIHIYIGVTSH